MTETFEKATKQSFQAARKDTDELKRSMNEWIIFLDGSLRDAKMRIFELERKIDELEAGKDEWN